MGKPLQILIAITCFAVLAVIGYWVWAAREAAQQAEQRASFERERAACLIDLEGHRHPANAKDKATSTFLVVDCLERGILTPSDVD